MFLSLDYFRFFIETDVRKLPLLVQGPCVLQDQAGNIVRESDNMVALCRCGLSNTKPMCDGSHTDNFDGTLNPPD